jgi:hypothetical protein
VSRTSGAAKSAALGLFVDALPHMPTYKVAKMVLKADKTLRQRAVDLRHN